MIVTSITGRLTRDPEEGYAGQNQDKRTTRFSVASSRGRKDMATGEYLSDFLSVIVYNPGLVDFVQRNLYKGRMVFASGRLESWKDRENATRWTLVADTLEPLDKRDPDHVPDSAATNGANESRTPAPAGARHESYDNDGIDDPFSDIG